MAYYTAFPLSFPMATDLGCRYLLHLISILDLQYSVFKVRSGIQMNNGIPTGLSGPFLPGEHLVPRE